MERRGLQDFTTEPDRMVAPESHFLQSKSHI